MADGVRVFVNGAGVSADVLADAVRTTLVDDGVDVGEVSVTLLDDEAIRDLNHRYLGKDVPTDVISFSLGEETVLGDVYLGVDQARRQAEEHGVPLEEELVRLAVHGALHVLGHDHPDGDERTVSPMFERQEALVRRILDRPDSGGPDPDARWPSPERSVEPDRGA